MPHSDVFELQLPARLAKVSHVVIKLGTAILTPHIHSGSYTFFNKLAKEIKDLQNQGKKVLIVSSGAVGFGRTIVGDLNIRLKDNRQDFSQKQALASLGQSLLIEKYRKSLQKFQLPCAQILVTREDFVSHQHFKNLKNTVDKLLEWGAIPVFNENDAVATDELKLGDNDTLAANISMMYKKSLLILLSSTDYFYKNDQAALLTTTIGPEEMRFGGKASGGGTGGMQTKLQAARKLLLAGQIMVIASGKDPVILRDLIAGKSCGSWFFNPSAMEASKSVKRFLIQSPDISGRIMIDSGAANALSNKNASLLLAGVIEIQGEFSKDALVDVLSSQNQKIARGKTKFDSKQIRLYIQNKDQYKNQVIIHKDQLALI